MSQRFFSFLGKKPVTSPADPHTTAVIPNTIDSTAEKNGNADIEEAGNGSDTYTENDAKPEEDAQEGVRRAEATTIIWPKAALIVVFVSIWFIYFTNAFQWSITANLTPYVMSGFDSHSLIPVIFIVSNIMAGGLRLAIAKMLNLWGRPQGFAVMVCIATLGLILMASCTTVHQFAAAQVFYQLGFDGLIYTADVVTSDSSSLRNRGIAFAITASPYIITAFAGPEAAEGFYEKISFRWAFGIFCIIVPFVAAPLFGTLTYYQHKAKKAGLLDRVPSGRTVPQSIWHYVIEFDLLGIVLFTAGFVLFLLPFSLAGSAAETWQSAHIIAMLVVGCVLIVAFALVERFVSPKPFLPFNLLLSRTVIFTCLLGASFQIGYYCWASYFSSYLQVVHNLTIAQAGYVGGVFDIISGLWIFAVGFLIRYTGRFKWLLIAAVVLDLLAIGLMVHFRKPHTPVGYLIMCQVFIAFAGGTIILAQQVAVMSVAKHNELAAVLALLGLFGYMGGAIGNTISGAIWTNTMPNSLQHYLPEEALADWESIYADLTVQLSYERGDPIREAIISAYGDAQRSMCIAGTVVMAIALVWTLLIKDVNVKGIKQVKGVVL